MSGPARSPSGAHAGQPGRRAIFQGPQPFGRYELLEEMGAGGMATLYLGRMTGPSNFEKFLAIKKIHEELMADPQMVEMFLDEARLSARIQHPNVVQIFEFDEVAGAHYIAMEYVHGHDLADLLRMAAHEPDCGFRWSHAARIVTDAAAGLHAAHELRTPDGKSLNLVHRDVSPQNILISYDGYVKVTDFGIAHAVDKLSKTLTGTVKGKVAYMAPEQVRGGGVDRRTDVFGLGIVLFEAVTLKRLFREPTDVATMKRVAAADVPRPRSLRPEIPTTLERVMLKALARDPADRYASAAELRKALESTMSTAGEMVGATELGELMGTLFSRHRIKRDLAVRSASQATLRDAPVLRGEDLAPTLAPGRGSSAELAPTLDPKEGFPAELPSWNQGAAAERERPGSAGAGRAASAAPAPRAAAVAASPSGKRRGARGGPRGGTLTLALAGVVVVLLLVVVVVLLRERREPRSPGTAAPAAVDRRPASDHVTLTFFVTPKEAQLLLDEKVRTENQGAFKRVLRVLRREQPIPVRVEAAGYAAKESTVLPVKDQLITMNLIREVRRFSASVDGGVADPPREAPPARRRRQRSRSRSRSGGARGAGMSARPGAEPDRSPARGMRGGGAAAEPL